MTTRWFRRFGRRHFTESYATFDAALHEETLRIKALRLQLVGLYEEIDLALRALDLLGEVTEHARERVRLRLAHPESPAPAVFTHTYRQRESREEA